MSHIETMTNEGDRQVFGAPRAPHDGGGSGISPASSFVAPAGGEIVAVVGSRVVVSYPAEQVGDGSVTIVAPSASETLSSRSRSRRPLTTRGSDLDDSACAPARRGIQAWREGVVRCWFSNKGRGVLAARPGALDGVREYYFDRRFLVHPGPIEEGNSVFFLPRPPMAGGRNPVAAMVVVEGAMIKASVDHVDPRGFGLSELRDGSDARQLLLIDFERLESTVTVGERIVVKIRAGDHGPIGIAQ